MKIFFIENIGERKLPQKPYILLKDKTYIFLEGNTEYLNVSIL